MVNYTANYSCTAAIFITSDISRWHKINTNQVLNNRKQNTTNKIQLWLYKYEALQTLQSWLD